MRNLVLTGGGTAGHCTPALALLPSLEKHFDNVYYIGSDTGIERKIVAKTHIKYYSVPTIKLKRSLSPANLKIPFTLTLGIKKSAQLLKELNASVVFSKGGYVALPVAIASSINKIPLVLHESDLSLGLANKISARFASEVLTSFPETADLLSNGRYVGAPISPLLFGANRGESKARYGIKNNKPVLLVMGGSSGSMAINRVLRGILPDITKKYNVLHITGEKNFDCNLTNVEGYFQVAFEEQMKYAYASSDIAISRAGSNSIFELIAMKLPAILIPLPRRASRGDQIENAEYFARKGMFKILYQENLRSENLLSAIDEIFYSRLDVALKQKGADLSANDRIAQRILHASLQ